MNAVRSIYALPNKSFDTDARLRASHALLFLSCWMPFARAGQFQRYAPPLIFTVMIIERDSLLRHLPQNLDPTQALYLDGIRFAIEMADMSYTRLQDTLWFLATNQSGESKNTGIISALHDAWSIVDSVDRLRGLLKLMPGVLKDSSPSLTEFLDATEEIRLLRNTVQHVGTLMPMLVSKKTPVWGVLSWFAWTNPDALEGNVCSLAAGTFMQGRPDPLPMPFEKEIKSRIDMITLTTRRKAVSLTDVMGHVSIMSRRINNALKRAFASVPSDVPEASGDMLLIVTIKFDEPKPMVE